MSFGCGFLKSFLAARIAPCLRVAFCFSVIWSGAAFGGTQSVWLSWDVAAWEQHIVKYRVYYGAESGVYTETVETFQWDGAVIPYLLEGSTNYFAVVGIDADGEETPMSEELMFVVPAQSPPVLATEVVRSATTREPSGMVLSSSWSLTGFWEIDYTSDFVNWSLWQTGVGKSAWTYVDFEPGEPTFFRLVLF